MNQILLIDDDQQLGPPLATYFKRFELGLTHALTPSEGLALRARGGYDAAILDVMLPEISGYEICQSMRLDPNLSDVKILMMTARGSAIERRKGIALGADGFIAKPFELKELRDEVRRLLGQGG